jgi:L-alanine-DL-glutamate epimerase-like enolase superfamily enzyme
VEPVTSFTFSLYKVYTDEGIVGYGPDTGFRHLDGLAGQDPHYVQAFWELYMGGRRAGNAGHNAAGIEIAMWDILGKAAGKPVYKLLGARRDRVPVYAATSRLMEEDEMVEQVRRVQEAGFRAVKLRLHRPNPDDDLGVVAAVREELGDEMLVLVDANQNNASEHYGFWSRRTALRMARALDDLGVYYLEEPLPRQDIEGLAEIALTVDMFVAGGEHTPTVYDFREHITRGAFDIVQPDATLGGNYGIIGLRRVAHLADAFGRLIVPHTSSGAGFTLNIAAALHAMATVENCPMVEYGFDPPILMPETTQAIVKNPIRVDEDGAVTMPDGPGLGIEFDEDMLEVVE